MIHDCMQEAFQFAVQAQNLQQASKDGSRKAVSETAKPEVPLWRKYTLSIEEAAEYFRIGQKRLRQIVAEDPCADFILMNGNRVQIKRKKFEEYIDVASAI